ncbi:pericentriolar material 1 protein isoform X2 [Ornithorhynchus anatinus]|uniref:pericentriolar material 1 protein isoform X2 n=1 Tax=Ornithorhynchus anatinus TaxID=9258 RepID=UPI0010A7ADE7|nr:pericentriolar material 1 protein isoform X2 [Ornithorhynchus anatinus]
MATGGDPFEDDINDQDFPNWSSESVDDRLNNVSWSTQQKKANRSSEKNKKKFGVESGKRLTNDISPESSPGVGRRRAQTPSTFPHSRYMAQMSVPEQAELEKLKQRINFSDLDQRSIGSDSQGRATAANNKRQLSESRKPYNFLSLQINTNKSKDAAPGPPKREGSGSSQCKESFALARSKDCLQNCQAPEETGSGEPAIDSSQVVSKLVQIRDYIAKASSMRDDLVEKNERSANVERLSHLLDHLKEQEKSYLKFLQKMLAREPQQETTEELENLKKQHDLLRRMLQQQEQLRALQGRQAALLALQHKAEQAIAVMDDSVVTETTGSISGISITSELNEELNDLIQRFHNQLHDSQTTAVPDNRRQAESLSLTREVLHSRTSSASQPPADEKVQLFSKMRVLQEKKQKMDKLLGELHTLRDQHLNNSSFVPVTATLQRSADPQRSPAVAAAAPAPRGLAAGGGSNRPRSPGPFPPESRASQNDSEEEEHLNPTEKLQKLNEVRKRLNELRELVHYFEQTSDMMTDAVNENTKDEEEEEEEDEEETEESEDDCTRETPQPVTNLRNAQGTASWGEGNGNTIAPGAANNRDGRSLNTNCEINNRSANLRTLNMSSTLDRRYNSESDRDGRVVRGEEKEDDEEDEEEGEEEEEEEEGAVEEDGVSEASLSSCRSSMAEDAEWEQKINRLISAKEKLRHLQDLVAMVQDGEAEPATESASAPGPSEFFTAGEELAEQHPDNARDGAQATERDARPDDKSREKFYEAKLQQQQKELKQLQEERKKLIDIQEKIQALQKECPDLQLSARNVGHRSTKRRIPVVTSTPAVTANGNPPSRRAVFEPADSSAVDNELWSEMCRHEILREELRQRRKQLEALMAEHQRRRELAEATSVVAASIRSEGSETQGTPQRSRSEKTVATWGGSPQCVLDEEDRGEDSYLSDGIVRGAVAADEEEEEEEEEGDDQETSSNENFSVHPRQSLSRSPYEPKGNKDRWKKSRPLSAEGNLRPVAKARQQNISMRRQENVRWMSELSHVEEKEQWQEQINQLKKQLDFSVSICQTLMQDQQTLSCLLQTLLTGPYSVMPSNVASPQVHLIMHQLNQCYCQLTWQQSNVQRLKQMLSDLMRQQDEHPEKPRRKERGSAPPPPSPSLFCPLGFPSQPMNLFPMPGFAACSPFAPGMNFNPVFPSNVGDFPQNTSPHNGQQSSSGQDTSGKTEHVAFPKPFESNSSLGAEKQRNTKPPEEEADPPRPAGLAADQEGGMDTQPPVKSGFAVAVRKMASNRKSQLDTSRRRRHWDEESLESFSSMPDPMDPTTVTKTFRTRKAAARASLAAREKTPKPKSRKRASAQPKNKEENSGYESASLSSTCEPCRSRNWNSGQPEELGPAQVLSGKNPEQLEGTTPDTRSTEISSAQVRRVLPSSPPPANRTACTDAPETGSDFSMFEALRDTIYSEVASLISQNESRPHFLIELFHELQLLDTDYLRQRALYALQDVVTRHVSKSRDRAAEGAKALNSTTWTASNSELTPSESLATTDEETFAKTLNGEECPDCESNKADNASSLSVSSNFEPFATEDLGNTVIHLDQALAKMKEYEPVKVEAESHLASGGDFPGAAVAAVAAATSAVETPNVNAQRAQEPAREASAAPGPRIDTQQLDRQIKAIMREVIPFLKEHMDEVCSCQLLTSVRRMVLTLTQQHDESKEFVKFFHKQLGSILLDSLAKFAGRKLRDCGEDLLVEISEVLFNELAFFKLMQDLDNNSVTLKQRGNRRVEAAVAITPFAKEAKRSLEGDPCSPPGEIDDVDKDKDETEMEKQARVPEVGDGRDGPRSGRSDVSDPEDEEESESCPLSISLSKAETQALTNYGSGEDENEDEEVEEFEEGPVDVQTSLQANKETPEENDREQSPRPKLGRPGGSAKGPSTPESTGTEGTQDGPTGSPALPAVSEQERHPNGSVSLPTGPAAAGPSREPGPDPPATQAASVGPAGTRAKPSAGSPESSVAGSPDTESPVLVNEFEAGSGNISQKSDEDDFVKVEDLPLKLTMYSEAELTQKMVAEEQNNRLTDEILAGNGPQMEELAGDSQLSKEPGKPPEPRAHERIISDPSGSVPSPPQVSDSVSNWS